MKLQVGTIYKDTENRRWLVEAKMVNVVNGDFPYLCSRSNAPTYADPLGQRPLGIFGWYNEYGIPTGPELYPLLANKIEREGYVAITTLGHAQPIIHLTENDARVANTNLEEDSSNLKLNAGIVAIAKVTWLE